MKHPYDVIVSTIEQSNGADREDMRSVLRDKLAYMEQIAKNKSLEESK